MQIVFPAVMLIIFMMLYMVYHSAAEAAHVLLAIVPFALSGGGSAKFSATTSMARVGRLHRALRHGGANRRRDDGGISKRR